MTERQLQRAVTDALTVYGYLWYHTHDSRHSPAGFPDVCAVRGARLVFAELKRAGQRLTPPQAQWLDALGQVTQVEAYVWRPYDLDTILEVLR